MDADFQSRQCHSYNQHAKCVRQSNLDRHLSDTHRRINDHLLGPVKLFVIKVIFW